MSGVTDGVVLTGLASLTLSWWAARLVSAAPAQSTPAIRTDMIHG
jgi:hypothetical protein